MKPCEIWIEQCEATRQIEAEFGTQNALDYLIGEKFLNFLQAAETDADFRAEIPAFVAGIKTIFETWQLAEYLETARQSEPFDPSQGHRIKLDVHFAIRSSVLIDLDYSGGLWE